MGNSFPVPLSHVNLRHHKFRLQLRQKQKLNCKIRYDKATITTERQKKCWQTARTCNCPSLDIDFIKSLWVVRLSFVLEFTVQKCKDLDMQNHNLTDCFVWVWNLVFHIEEKCRLKVFENKVLRKILRPKRDEATGEWRRLHNKELYAPYASPNIIRVIKSKRLIWAGHVARMGEGRDAYRVLLGKHQRSRPLERPRSRWEDNIRMDLREAGWGMDWIDLAQDRDRWRALVNAIMNLLVP